MRAMAVKRYFPRLSLFVQVLQPENQVHFTGIADHIICTEAFKMGILAQNVLAPGFISFLHVITTSISDESQATLVSEGEENDWLREYAQGCVMEIYTIPRLGEAFEGISYEEACASIKAENSACLFALGIPKPSGIDIVLNPIGYVIQGTETAYVLCQDFQQIATISLKDSFSSPIADEEFDFLLIDPNVQQYAHLDETDEGSPLLSTLERATPFKSGETCIPVLSPSESPAFYASHIEEIRNSVSALLQHNSGSRYPVLLMGEKI